MTHLNDGLLRRLVDEPFAASDSQQCHYGTCARCQARFASIETEARATASMLETNETVPNAAAALTRFHARMNREALTASARQVHPVSRGTRRVGAVVGTAALLGALVAWSPVGAWADSFITVFQPAAVGSVDVSTADLHSLAGLAKYGTVKVSSNGHMQTFHSATDASAAMNMHLVTPASLPQTVDVAPVYEVMAAQAASFTFSASKARAAAGPTAPAMPAHIDGSTLHVSLQPAAATVYGASGNIPELVVGQMRAPEITATGVSVSELENYLLNLPNVPASVRSQILAIQNPTGTLPIPIPVDQAHSIDVTVQGVHGLMVGDNTGLGSGVIWERDGIIYGVAGPMSQDQILAVANSLR